MRVKPFFKDNLIKIFNKDSSNMSEVEDKSVALVVTSPPYWDLKNYNHKKQIGLGQTYEEYIEKLEIIIKECYRVLEKGRYLAIVIGTRISDNGLKHIPFDLKVIFENSGFNFKKEFIWVKPKGTQGLWQRGTTQFLKKNPFPGQLNINIQHEFIHLYQKNGEFKSKKTVRLSEDFIKEIAWSVWQLPVSRQKGHPAPFPGVIPYRLIKAYTYPGELVLDPFLGSGTTAQIAKDLGRRCIGYELSVEYCNLSKENLCQLL